MSNYYVPTKKWYTDEQWEKMEARVSGQAHHILNTCVAAGGKFYEFDPWTGFVCISGCLYDQSSYHEWMAAISGHLGIVNVARRDFTFMMVNQLSHAYGIKIPWDLQVVNGIPRPEQKFWRRKVKTSRRWIKALIDSGKMAEIELKAKIEYKETENEN